MMRFADWSATAHHLQLRLNLASRNNPLIDARFAQVACNTSRRVVFAVDALWKIRPLRPVSVAVRYSAPWFASAV